MGQVPKSSAMASSTPEASAVFNHRRRQMPSVREVGRTRAFRRYHRRTQGILRRAGLAESRALVRLLQSAENLAADADRRFFRLQIGHLVDALGVEVFIRGTQTIATHGNRSDATPFAVA